MENREFLSLDENSLNTDLDPETRKIFLDKVKEYTKELLKDKQDFVDRYDKKDVEDILKGKAIKDAIIYIKNMKRKDIKELVIKSLTEVDFSIKEPYIIKSLKAAKKFLGMSDDEIGKLEKLKKEEIPEAIRGLNSYYSSAAVYEIESPKQGLIYVFQSRMSDRIHVYKENGEMISYLEETKTINSKKYISEKEENPEDKITMDVPLFIRMLEYAREDASNDVDLHDVAKKTIGLSSEGEVLTMDDYESIVGETESLDEDLDLGHQDNEPHMIKGELYHIGKYAMELYKIIDGFEGKGEVDFPAWWQSKITTAKNMISSAKHYLDFELKEPAINNVVNTLTDKKSEIYTVNEKKAQDVSGPKGKPDGKIDSIDYLAKRDAAIKKAKKIGIKK
jgi:hypothetical protein